VDLLCDDFKAPFLQNTGKEWH